MNAQLDDRSFVTRLDPADMYGLTIGFPNQCRKALEIARTVSFKPTRCQNVVLTGLGGSAVGGDFVKALFDDQAKVPFSVNRDYHLPNWVSGNSLVIATSYSGNTEETLSAYNDALDRGAHRLVVTSGGKLQELAKVDDTTTVIIPGGQPPRTALGFMFVPVAHACVEMGLIPEQDFESAFALLDRCSQEWGVETSAEKNEAKQIAMELHGAVSVIYGLGSWQGIVANRWKGQINENAKDMTFANAFPELNHNEILGWVKANEQGVARWVALVLEDGSESAKMQARRDVTAKLIEGVAKVHRLRARGETLLEKMLSLVFLGDFVSLYLAALNGVDPENIDSINHLKSELAKVR